MTFIINNWYWFLMAIGSGVLIAFPEILGDGSTKGIDLNEAVRLMNREKGVLVDIREPAEFAQGRVAQARNIPMAELNEKLPGAIKNKNLPVLFICASGLRSARAAKMAQKLGFENAHSVAGGMQAWRKANMPVMAPSDQSAAA
ncbi:MAG: rhodanese-like domain-containing protein [Brachymonas sp.]|nr:rhodanese-like domain-containing protein [Brachymonas sp.]